MKKYIIGASIALAIVILLSQGAVVNALLIFLLTGSIPGTKVSIPYWIMMAFYCAIIALIMTDTIDAMFRTAKQSKRTRLRKSRMPHRRYSNNTTHHSA